MPVPALGPKTSGSSPPRKPPGAALVSSDWPSPDDPERDRFEDQFWAALTRSAPEVAEAMARPLAIKFAHVRSVGWTCDPATMEYICVDWRDISEPLARRAAAFANAQMESESKG